MTMLTFFDYQTAALATTVYPSLGEMVRKLTEENADGYPIFGLFADQSEDVLTAVEQCNPGNIYYTTIALCGEVGEIANKVKKIMRDHNGHCPEALSREIRDEIGDALYYLAALTTEMDESLQSIAEDNLKKLQDRQQADTLKGSGDGR